jgi:Flp pilus assembly protein TadG
MLGATSNSRKRAFATKRTGRRLRRLGRDASGSSLIEFSLVAVPLFFLIFGSIEIGLVYWATQQLENATAEVGRLVRTGQVFEQGFDREQLKSRICARARALPRCTSRLRLDIRSATTYNLISAPAPYDGDGALKDDGSFQFAPGGSGDAALVTSFYTWQAVLIGRPYLLRASTPLRNEPF